MHPSGKPLGVWIVGARGGVATTAIAGALLLARSRVRPLGLATAGEPLASAWPWRSFGDLRFGGHEVRAGSLCDSARAIGSENGSIRAEWVDELADDLARIDRAIRPGLLLRPPRAVERFADLASVRRPTSFAEAVAIVREDLRAFREEIGADRVVTVNLASTEDPFDVRSLPGSPEKLERLAVGEEQPDLAREWPASLAYAAASCLEGAPFVHFTPSQAPTAHVVAEWFASRGVPLAGSDGKTGETLVKTALAPMFRRRALEVRLWQGYNMLGDRDGAVLSEEGPLTSKLRSKQEPLASILGYEPAGGVRIDFLPPLGDQKTAWDFILFEGFLNHAMRMQFTWEGCDAVLAAPLVLDLVRLCDRALDKGQGGPLGYLAFYFKRPLGCSVHDLHAQWRMLEEEVARTSR